MFGVDRDMSLKGLAVARAREDGYRDLLRARMTDCENGGNVSDLL